MDEAVPDTETVAPATVLWGWDAMPSLPIGSGDLEDEHTDRPLFPPSGGASVNLVVFPPADAGPSAMHRTDTVDFLFVLEGEVVLRHPGCDDITLTAGDFFVQNGALHQWENLSDKKCVMACIVLATQRTR
jgi:quercetin dioxygenase-like cupin family protein